MWRTNLKIVTVGALTMGFYTFIAQIIPQLESSVPATIDLSAGVTPEVLVTAGQELFAGAGGCTACHGLGTRAPNLLTDHAGEGTIGARCGDREGECKDYLFASLTDPSAYLVEGFPPIMTPAQNQLDQSQIWAIIAYLQSNGGTVTVTADDLGATAAAPVAGPAAGPGAGSGVTDPMELLVANACTGCHVLDGAVPAIQGPSFDGMGSRMTADQIRVAILDPAATIAAGFEDFQGLMPTTFGSTLSARQLENIVQFLAGRR